MSVNPNEPHIVRDNMRQRISERIRMKRIELAQAEAHVQSIADQISLLSIIEDDVENIGRP